MAQAANLVPSFDIAILVIPFVKIPLTAIIFVRSLLFQTQIKGEEPSYPVATVFP